MALIFCKECGAKVSSSAGNCPHCGALVKRKQSNGPSILLIIIFVGGIVVANMSAVSDKGAKRQSVADATKTEAIESPGSGPPSDIAKPVEDERIRRVEYRPLEPAKPMEARAGTTLKRADLTLSEASSNDFTFLIQYSGFKCQQVNAITPLGEQGRLGRIYRAYCGAYDRPEMTFDPLTYWVAVDVKRVKPCVDEQSCRR